MRQSTAAGTMLGSGVHLLELCCCGCRTHIEIQQTHQAAGLQQAHKNSRMSQDACLLCALTQEWCSRSGHAEF
jgi:hypothetical protein